MTLKKMLKCRRFRSDEDVNAAVVQWFQLQQQPREFFAEGIHRLVRLLDACINAHECCF
jgi:hypothetical protein